VHIAGGGDASQRGLPQVEHLDEAVAIGAMGPMGDVGI